VSRRRAIISVYRKEGVEDLARGLVARGFEVVSTGGTAEALRKAGVPVVGVTETTGFPEILDGRVKTLQPQDPRRHPGPAQRAPRTSRPSRSTASRRWTWWW
jgi:hypothetical protein